MGLLAGGLAIAAGADQEKWRLLLGVGVLGGFTTFSAFSLETALMIERRPMSGRPAKPRLAWCCRSRRCSRACC